MPVLTKNRSLIVDRESTLMCWEGYDKNNHIAEDDPLRSYGWEPYTDVIEYRLSQNIVANAIGPYVPQPAKRALAFFLDSNGYYAKVIVNHKKKLMAVLTAGTQFSIHEDFIPNLMSDLGIVFTIRPAVLSSAKEFLDHIRTMRDEHCHDYEIIHIGQSLGGFISTYNAAIAGEFGLGLDSPGSGHLLTEAQRENAEKYIIYYQAGDENVVNTLNLKIGRVYRYVIDGCDINEEIRGSFIGTHAIEIALKAIDPVSDNFRELVPLGRRVESSLRQYVAQRVLYLNALQEHQEQAVMSASYSDGEHTHTFLGKHLIHPIAPPALPPKPVSSDYTHQSKVGDRYRTELGLVEVCAKKKVYNYHHGKPLAIERGVSRIEPSPVLSDSARLTLAPDTVQTIDDSVTSERSEVVESSVPQSSFVPMAMGLSYPNQSSASSANSQQSVPTVQNSSAPITLRHDPAHSESIYSSTSLRATVQAPEVLAPYEVSFVSSTDSVYGFRDQNQRSFSLYSQSRDSRMSRETGELQNFMLQTVRAEYPEQSPLFEDKKIEWSHDAVSWSGNKKEYNVGASADYAAIAAGVIGVAQKTVRHFKKSDAEKAMGKVDAAWAACIKSSESRPKKASAKQREALSVIANARSKCGGNPYFTRRLDAIEYGIRSKDPLATSPMGQRRIDLDLDDRVSSLGQKLDTVHDRYAQQKTNAIEAHDAQISRNLDTQYHHLPAYIRQRYKPLDDLIEINPDIGAKKADELHRQAIRNGDGAFFEKIQFSLNAKRMKSGSPQSTSMPRKQASLQVVDPNAHVQSVEQPKVPGESDRSQSGSGSIKQGRNEQQDKNLSRDLNNARSIEMEKIRDDIRKVIEFVNLITCTYRGLVSNNFIEDDETLSECVSLLEDLSVRAFRAIRLYDATNFDERGDLISMMTALIATEGGELLREFLGQHSRADQLKSLNYVSYLGDSARKTIFRFSNLIMLTPHAVYKAYLHSDQIYNFAITAAGAFVPAVTGTTSAEASTTTVAATIEVAQPGLLAQIWGIIGPYITLVNAAAAAGVVTVGYAGYQVYYRNDDPEYIKYKAKTLANNAKFYHKNGDMINAEKSIADIFVETKTAEDHGLAFQTACDLNILTPAIEQYALKSFGRPGEWMAEIFLMKLSLSGNDPQIDRFFNIASDFESRSEREIEALPPDSSQAKGLRDARRIMLDSVCLSFSEALEKKIFSLDFYKHARKFSKFSEHADSYLRTYELRRNNFIEYLGFRAVDGVIFASSSYVAPRTRQRLASVVSASRNALGLHRNQSDVFSILVSVVSLYELMNSFTDIPDESYLHSIAKTLGYLSTLYSVVTNTLQFSIEMINVQSVRDLTSLNVVSAVNGVALAVWPVVSGYLPDGPKQGYLTSSNYGTYLRQELIKRMKQGLPLGLTGISDVCQLYRHGDLLQDWIHDAGYSWAIERGAEFALRFVQMATLNNLLPVGMWTAAYVCHCFGSRHQNSYYISFVTQSLLHNAEVYFKLREVGLTKKCLRKIFEKSDDVTHHMAALTLALDMQLFSESLYKHALKTPQSGDHSIRHLYLICYALLNQDVEGMRLHKDQLQLWLNEKPEHNNDLINSPSYKKLVESRRMAKILDHFVKPVSSASTSMLETRQYQPTQSSLQTKKRSSIPACTIL